MCTFLVWSALYSVSYPSIIHSFSLILHLAVPCMVWLPPIASLADQKNSGCALFFVLSRRRRRCDLLKPYLLICSHLTCYTALLCENISNTTVFTGKIY